MYGWSWQFFAQELLLIFHYKRPGRWNICNGSYPFAGIMYSLRRRFNRHVERKIKQQQDLEGKNS